LFTIHCFELKQVCKFKLGNQPYNMLFIDLNTAKSTALVRYRYELKLYY